MAVKPAPCAAFAARSVRPARAVEPRSRPGPCVAPRDGGERHGQPAFGARPSAGGASGQTACQRRRAGICRCRTRGCDPCSSAARPRSARFGTPHPAADGAQRLGRSTAAIEVSHRLQRLDRIDPPPRAGRSWPGGPRGSSAAADTNASGSAGLTWVEQAAQEARERECGEQPGPSRQCKAHLATTMDHLAGVAPSAMRTPSSCVSPHAVRGCRRSITPSASAVGHPEQQQHREPCLHHRARDDAPAITRPSPASDRPRRSPCGSRAPATTGRAASTIFISSLGM